MHLSGCIPGIFLEGPHISYHNYILIKSISLREQSAIRGMHTQNVRLTGFGHGLNYCVNTQEMLRVLGFCWVNSPLKSQIPYTFP
jgi:hypothetical protein